jgi:hypothetical protein
MIPPPSPGGRHTWTGKTTARLSEPKRDRTRCSVKSGDILGVPAEHSIRATGSICGRVVRRVGSNEAPGNSSRRSGACDADWNAGFVHCETSTDRSETNGLAVTASATTPPDGRADGGGRRPTEWRRHVRRNARSTQWASALPRPEEPKPSAVPDQHRHGRDDHDDVSPSVPHLRDPDPQESVHTGEPHPLRAGSFHDLELMAERENLKLQGRSRTEGRAERQEHRSEYRSH